MSDEPIFAKSAKSGVTLLQHTADVMEAVCALFGSETSPTRLGLRWQRFFQFKDYASFFRCTLAAAAFHDWGKANDGFQNAASHRGSQTIRHEHLSGLIITLPDHEQWIRSRLGAHFDVMLAAVITHHLKTSLSTFAQMRTENTRIELLTDRAEFHEMVRMISDAIDLPGEVPKVAHCVWDYTSHARRMHIRPHLEKVQSRLVAFRRNLDRPDQQEQQRLLMAVRAALIAADSAGSAIRRKGISLTRWIEKAFDPEKQCTRDSVWRDVIGPRIEEMRRQGREFHWSEFQEQCAVLPSRALLLAPCGSGKTLAAWRWIAEQCGEGVQRVIFLYPTRATATEGFRDYVSWAPEADAALMHGTAEYDLQSMFDNPEDDDERGAKRFEVDQRLFALGFWTRRIFSATVDQFLAFLQHGYGSTCLLPLLVDSVVVIDEVHSFDGAMHSALKDFLKAFQVPVLCMTATLPESRRRELETECRLHTADGKPGELKEVASAPRYQVTVREEPALGEIEARVAQALEDGKRVLWIANQVSRVQNLVARFAVNFPFCDLQTAGGAPIICYHSRFTLDDRCKRHQQLVRSFQQNRGAILAFGTQVCEMSLDIDADLLVTEYAPVTSLIQRMGRCNRARQPRKGAGQILIYRPDNEKPYDDAALAGLGDFLAAIVGKDWLTQEDLEQALAQIPMPAELGRDCRFLTSGPFALSGEQSFRDIDEFTVPAILDRDVLAFHAMRERREPTDGLVVPAPRWFAKANAPPNRPAGLPDYLHVVPARFYHPAVGLRHEPVKQLGAIIV